MRCADCETESLNVARHCEGCGREVLQQKTEAEEPSLFGEQAEETPLVDGETEPVASGADNWAPNPNPTSDLRYQSFGGVSPAADSFRPDQEASEIAQAGPLTPQGDEATASAETRPVEEIVSSPPRPSAELPRPDPAIVASMVANFEKARPPQTTSVQDNAAVAKPIDAEAVKTRESPPRRAKVDPALTEKVRKSADVTRVPNSPVAPQRRIHPLAAAAAVAFVAIGIGAPWIYKTPVISRLQELAMSFEKHATSEIADVQNRAALPTEPPVAPATAIQDRSAASPEEHPAAATLATLPKEHPADPTPATQDRKPSGAVSAVASTPNGRKPTPGAALPRRAPVPSVAAKPVGVKDPIREVPAVPVLASAPVIAPVDVVATAPPPAPATPPPATGPFFETRDVSESPRIATRAEPRLPDELKHHSVKEMIIVRALVSQNGHPSRVSLLRRSKTGPQLDDVVLAAVNQWTFSPAKKKGEPVSCWFNFAVEVGGAE